MSTRTSRIDGFRDAQLTERRALVAAASEADGARALGAAALPDETAEHMIENCVGSFALPLGVALNLRVNGHDCLVPMAVEEPSVLAAVSAAAKVVRKSGGFVGSADPPIMIGQVQIVECEDPVAAAARVRACQDEILAAVDALHPALVARGGGARGVEVRVLVGPPDLPDPMLVVHLLIDCREAMGANLVNTACEGIAPLLEHVTGGRAALRILSNLCDRRCASAECAIPLDMLAHAGYDGASVAAGVVEACRFAEADPYRAATHNKGIMNGIDPAAIALGQDWRAIEAGAHAFAARDGQYRPLTSWRVRDEILVGRIRLPLAVGTIGGPVQVHPAVAASRATLGVHGAAEIAVVIAAVGLAQNFSAIRALGTVGIQRGHMALHARTVAMTAGARGDEIRRVAGELAHAGAVGVDAARHVLSRLRGEVVT